jgi:hypothetical protein
MLALTVICVAAVVVAALIRVGRSQPVPGPIRSWATVLAVATPIGLAAFALLGPLASGWARRAGTPPLHLASAVTSTPTAPVVRRSSSPLLRPFTAPLSGTVAQSNAANGGIIELNLRLGGPAGQLRIRLGGAPLPQGGLTLTGSQADLTGPGLPSALGGKVTSLTGSNIVARVKDTSGTAVDLHANLSIDQNSGAVTGTLTGTPVPG